MADLGTTIKGVWLKGMEAIGNAASNIASNTKSKVDEMNLMNRRTEILSDFGNKAYTLWQKGEAFPPELDEQLHELQKLDEKLNDLRAERLAGVKPPVVDAAEEAAKETDESEAADESAASDADEATETDAAETAPQDECEGPEMKADEPAEDPEEEKTQSGVPVIRVEKPEEAEQAVSDVKESIQSLFDKAPTAQEAADKVNDAIDSLEEGLKQFGDRMDQTISELTDRIKGE